jgi:small subunit ribosomal protein S1
VDYDYTSGSVVILQPVPTKRVEGTKVGAQQESGSTNADKLGAEDALTFAKWEDSSTSIVVRHPIYRYKAGQRVVGRITDIKEFGIFLDTEPDVGGLVHKTKMWGYVADARDFPFKVGDKIKVEVLSVDYEKAKLELGLLREHDPILKYQLGDIVRGKVTEVRNYGAFVELEPGVRGLVRKKNTWWGFIEDMRDFLWEDEEVTVRILSIDRQKHEMDLSLQVNEHDPLLAYGPGDVVHASVTQVKDYGAFVEVEPGVTGLILLKDMGAHVQNVRRVLEEHDEVEALVISIDDDRRRLLLRLESKIS